MVENRMDRSDSRGRGMGEVAFSSSGMRGASKEAERKQKSLKDILKSSGLNKPTGKMHGQPPRPPRKK